MKGTQNWYEITRQTELGTKNTIIYHEYQPVLIKPVVILNQILKILRSYGNINL